MWYLGTMVIVTILALSISSPTTAAQDNVAVSLVGQTAIMCARNGYHTPLDITVESADLAPTSNGIRVTAVVRAMNLGDRPASTSFISQVQDERNRFFDMTRDNLGDDYLNLARQYGA